MIEGHSTFLRSDVGSANTFLRTLPLSEGAGQVHPQGLGFQGGLGFPGGLLFRGPWGFRRTWLPVISGARGFTETQYSFTEPEYSLLRFRYGVVVFITKGLDKGFHRDLPLTTDY